MKILYSGLLLLALAFTAQAQKKDDFFKPFGKSFVVSTSIYAGGATADILSSRGKFESNSLSRNSEGRFDTGKNIALTAGVYGATLLFEKKHPKIAFWVRTLTGGIRFGYAAHNSRIK